MGTLTRDRSEELAKIETTLNGYRNTVDVLMRETQKLLNENDELHESLRHCQAVNTQMVEASRKADATIVNLTGRLYEKMRGTKR